MFKKVKSKKVINGVSHWLCIWDDETSAFDPKGEWQGGSEYYKRTFKIWVPETIKDTDEDEINDYIDRNEDNAEVW